ncbi:MAG: hypothetical protein L6R37_004349 [Teloschistes peruensis]|nr:MAG: hypothetical protein L6R37_004349 [Teloschistes peruensis]
MSAPFVYISGFPGVGKFTVAKELVKLLPNAKLLDNHTLIDPVATLYEREMPEYNHLRKVVRQDLLKSVATSQSLKNVTMIFTDVQAANDWGIAAVSDYIEAAYIRGSMIISIMLECTAEVNCYRMMTEGRGKFKFQDALGLLYLRECEPLFRFKTEEELILNNDKLPAYNAARKILEFMKTVVPKEDADLVFGDLI